MNMNDMMDTLKAEGMKQSCFPRWVVAIVAIVLMVALVSCATLEPPMSVQQDRAACYASYRAPARAVFADPRDQLLSQVVESLTNKGAHPCDAMSIAYLQAQGKIIEQQYALGSKALGIVGIIGGIYATGSVLESIVGAGSAGISATASGGSSISVNNVSATARDMAGGFGGVGWTAEPTVVDPTIVTTPAPTIVQPTIVTVP